jgi:hypothetical protein
MIVFEVPLALGVLVVGWRQLFNPKQLSLLFLLFCLGFSVYLYLPLATLTQPYVSWGDGTTWQGFIRHLLRCKSGFTLLDALVGSRSSMHWSSSQFRFTKNCELRVPGVRGWVRISRQTGRG